MSQEIETVTPAEVIAASILPFCFAKHTATRRELHVALARDIQRAINDAVIEAKQLPTYDPEVLYPTQYDLWLNGKIGNFGNFQMTIFKAFQYADFENRRRLAAVFPKWFATTQAV